MAIRPLIVVVLGVLLFAVPAFSEDKFFDSNGVQIRYVDEGSGEPIVLLHGFSGNLERSWIDIGVFENLQKDFRVIAFDSRGNGKSGKPHSPDVYGLEMPRDAIRLLNHLKIQKAHFVGYSFGGHVVAKLLTTNPERFITATLGGSSGRRTVEDPKANEQEAIEVTGGSLRSVPVPAVSIGQPPTEEAIRTASERLTANVDVLALAAMVRGRPALFVSNSQMANVKVPTLAIIGSLDPEVKGVYELKKVMPPLEVVVIEGAVHPSGAPRGAPSQPEFVNAIRAWIAKHQTSPETHSSQRRCS